MFSNSVCLILIRNSLIHSFFCTCKIYKVGIVWKVILDIFLRRNKNLFRCNKSEIYLSRIQLSLLPQIKVYSETNSFISFMKECHNMYNVFSGPEGEFSQYKILFILSTNILTLLLLFTLLLMDLKMLLMGWQKNWKTNSQWHKLKC